MTALLDWTAASLRPACAAAMGGSAYARHLSPASAEHAKHLRRPSRLRCQIGTLPKIMLQRDVAHPVLCADSLERDCLPVTARVCSRTQDSAVRIARNRVYASDVPGPGIFHMDLVPAIGERGSGCFGNAGLHVHARALEGAHPRSFDAGLDVHAEDEPIEQHL